MNASPRYINVWYRTGVAFLGAVFIVFYGRWTNFSNALTSVHFWTAFAVSFSVALLMVYMVHSATLKLDKKYHWIDDRWKRIKGQIYLGLFFPAVTDLALITVYLLVAGQLSSFFNFIMVDYLVIVGFLIILNCYYLVHFLIHHLLIIREKVKSANLPDAGSREKLTIHYKGSPLEILHQEILYIYRVQKKICIVSVHGHAYPNGESLASLMATLQNSTFYQINPSVVINSMIVQEFQRGDKQYTWRIIVKPEYQNVLTRPESDLLVVTRKYISPLKDDFMLLFRF